MNQHIALYVIAHAGLVASYSAVATMFLILIIRKSSAIEYKWVVLPVTLWLVSTAVVHLTDLLSLKNSLDLVRIVLLCLNMVASVIATIYITTVFKDLYNKPTFKEMKLTNDALAKTVGELHGKLEGTQREH